MARRKCSEFKCRELMLGWEVERPDEVPERLEPVILAARVDKP